LHCRMPTSALLYVCFLTVNRHTPFSLDFQSFIIALSVIIALF